MAGPPPHRRLESRIHCCIEGPHTLTSLLHKPPAFNRIKQQIAVMDAWKLIMASVELRCLLSCSLPLSHCEFGGGEEDKDKETFSRRDSLFGCLSSAKDLVLKCWAGATGVVPPELEEFWNFERRCCRGKERVKGFLLIRKRFLLSVSLGTGHCFIRFGHSLPILGPQDERHGRRSQRSYLSSAA
ncbi:hypothetical protein OPV22_006875 [Ensete ventricosum]|uniref:Uncharacterized protein n=1 Tax=Ensete ventricosum TaxID=4639 RepID=A0AAV8RP10_ENSVE|nr:hypothetical protein OPV22_006875 [Ensete ventricosum]